MYKYRDNIIYIMILSTIRVHLIFGLTKIIQLQGILIARQ